MVADGGKEELPVEEIVDIEFVLDTLSELFTLVVGQAVPALQDALVAP